MSTWTNDIENVLEAIRINSVIYSKEHKRKYFYLKNKLQYFRLPVIILSGINSVISVGFQPYMYQGHISIVTCLLALICSIIGSIELYLAVQKKMENELMSSRDYYILAIDIYKTLTLKKEHRHHPAKEYLEKKYEEYIKLNENSNLLAKKLTDKMSPLPIDIEISTLDMQDKVEEENIIIKNNNIITNLDDTNINREEDKKILIEENKEKQEDIIV